MQIKNVIAEIEKIAPLSYQESYDNTGLIVGDGNREVVAVLLCFDVNLEVIDEAIELGANLIISHHPVIFSGLKKITGKSTVEQIVIKAIKNDIALYSAHTNLDNVQGGISFKLAEKLGLTKVKVLQPVQNKLVKLVCYVPVSHTDKVRKALFEKGAGHIGNYSSCSFKHEGIGSFCPQEGSNPHVGKINALHEEREERLELIVERRILHEVVTSMRMVHPYEEPAYDIYPLELPLHTVGSGAIGELEQELSLDIFFLQVKKNLDVVCIRHNASYPKIIKRVAVCGGSGSNLISEAIREGADILITGDCKYHQFIDFSDRLVLADIGHYESECFATDIIHGILREKKPNFAVYLSANRINPIHYF